MNGSARESYVETQVLTATPQRLRLMLIEAALRHAQVAQRAWSTGNEQQGVESASHCRSIVSELISSIQPDQSPLAKRVLGIYLYLFSTLAEAEFARDANRLNDIIRVLEEERTTWQAVCEQMPDRPVAASTINEEVAPQRVADGWTGGYTPNHAAGRKIEPASAFSIEA